MARPRFEVVDDPLALTGSDEGQAEAGDVSPPHASAAAPRRQKPASTAKRGRTTGSTPTPARPSRREADGPGQRPLPDPPALDEPLTLVAARLPRSLDRVLDEHTQQLRRARDGVSQKKLPKQEVLAMAVWALGDPDDERTRDRLGALYEEYRGRRLAAAAEAALEKHATRQED